MKKWRTGAAILCMLFVLGCASRTTTDGTAVEVDTIEPAAASAPARSGDTGDGNTPECELMQEVCDEAHAFQAEFQKMPEEQQKDVTAVLNTYVEHCTHAREACEKSKQQ